MSDWKPSSPIEELRSRADLYAKIRTFFHARDVLEVDTPLLAGYAVTDPNIELFEVPTSTGARFLQSSPEYAMKRLLAAGSGDIFQLGKAFRFGESGRRHNPEFTLLEWYRLGFTHYDLIREVSDLLRAVLAINDWQVWSYEALFQEILGLDLCAASVKDLEVAVSDSNINVDFPQNRLDYLDLLMTHIIEPEIADWGLVFVMDFLPEQSALSRIVERSGRPVAARFEAYFQGVELANGYYEESSPDILLERFANDNQKRRDRGQPERDIDPRFIDSLRIGLPECSGVAVGVDRLLMLAREETTLSHVLPFAWDRA